MSLRKIRWTELIRLHKQKLPKKIVIRTKLKSTLYIAYFRDIKVRTFCAKFSGLKCELRIFEKPLVVKPSELFCFKDTINFTALLLFLSGINGRCIWVKYLELNSIA